MSLVFSRYSYQVVAELNTLQVLAFTVVVSYYRYITRKEFSTDRLIRFSRYGFPPLVPITVMSISQDVGAHRIRRCA